MPGHIQKRGENTWRLYVSAGFDAEGKRIMHTKTFKGTESQAKKALALFVADIERDVYEKPQKMICRDLFKKWLETYGKFNLKPTTYETFKRYLLKRVCDTPFATIQVKKLSSSDFYKLYNELRNKYRYSNKTLLQIHRIMHSAFSTAMSWTELNLTHHPMNGVVAPVPEKKKINRLKEEEVIEVLNTALQKAPFWFFVFLSLGFTSGLRRGELLGLRWEDIRADINKLNVYQNVVRVKGKGLIIETPKNDEPRLVSVPQDTIDLLQLYRNRVESAKGKQNDSDLIFSTASGKPISPDDVSHLMKRFIDRNNLPKVTIHGARHSNATILINKGVSLKEVSDHLGHSTTQITDIIYTEVWDEKKKAVADKLNGLIPKLEPPRNNVIQLQKKAK